MKRMKCDDQMKEGYSNMTKFTYCLESKGRDSEDQMGGLLQLTTFTHKLETDEEDGMG